MVFNTYTIIKEGVVIKPKNVLFGNLNCTFGLPLDSDIIREGVQKANYISVNVTGRTFYYYIESIDTIGMEMRIKCTLDVIATYSTEIKNAYALKTRCIPQNERKEILSNDEWIYDVRKTCYKQEFTGAAFNYDNPTKIMVTIKGNK